MTERSGKTKEQVVQSLRDNPVVGQNDDTRLLSCILAVEKAHPGLWPPGQKFAMVNIASLEPKNMKPWVTRQ